MKPLLLLILLFFGVIYAAAAQTFIHKVFGIGVALVVFPIPMGLLGYVLISALDEMSK